MTPLTGLQQTSSNQHVEMGKSRAQRDTADIMKILQWLEAHNPFTRCDPALTSLSTGLTAEEDDGINCDLTEEIGEAIQQQMDGCTFSEVTLNKRCAVMTMIQLQKGIKDGEKTVHIKRGNLFNRLVVLAERSEDMMPCFKYEFTSMPASLFKDGLMHKLDKAALGRLLSKKASVKKDSRDQTHVLDGGALLHHVRWPKVGTYAEILRLYLYYISKCYAKDTVIVSMVTAKCLRQRIKNTCNPSQPWLIPFRLLQMLQFIVIRQHSLRTVPTKVNLSIPSVNACKRVAIQCAKQLVMQIL